MTDIEFIKNYTTDTVTIQDNKLKYLLSENKLKGYIGPRQSGKTYLLYQDLICNAFNEPGEYLVVAPNYPALKRVQDNIKDCLDKFLLDYKKTYTCGTYTTQTLPNGSNITFIAGYNLNDNFLRGKRFKSVFLDEPLYIAMILNKIEKLITAVSFTNGSVSVFGTMGIEFASHLIDMGFDLIMESD